jgi:acetyl-CoA carboxylase biotin carboxylase subunit
VPVVPGTLEPAAVRADQAEALVAEATRIGFPLLVKAAAGGGGRGMRRVESREGLLAELAAGSAEAASAFGDGSVYLEREVRPARHIEVQLLGDRLGRVVALGERDCSVQRRNQKLVEESPAPHLAPDQRRELHAIAVRLGEAARLDNAATAEFLLDPDGRFWFLEVNTRLQVEHGVTELAADVDIVVEQLHLAAGRPLAARITAAADRAADPGRHAIEVRLSAEDPARDFSPAPGRVGRWVMPAGPGIRIDTATEPGDRVPPDYDPLIAKLLVVGQDRPSAIARLRRALDEVEVTGIQTTLPFLRFIARDEAFAAGELSTSFVAERWDASAHRRSALADAVRIAAARRTVVPTGPVSLRKDSALADGWRTAGRRAAADRWPRR